MRYYRDMHDSPSKGPTRAEAQDNYETGLICLGIAGVLFFAMVVGPGIYLLTQWSTLDSGWDTEATAGVVAGSVISLPVILCGAYLVVTARRTLKGFEPAPAEPPRPAPTTAPPPAGPSPLPGLLKWVVVVCILSFVIAVVAVALLSS